MFGSGADNLQAGNIGPGVTVISARSHRVSLEGARGTLGTAPYF